MLRTLAIILILCGGLAWFLTGQAPQRTGTLTLQPAPEFPEAAKADLGRSVARFLPHCPGFSQFGGEVRFTHLVQEEGNTTAGATTRITFNVPQNTRIPEGWGPYTQPCTFILEGDTLRIRETACQALCVGKRPNPVQDELIVDLNPPAKSGK